MVLEYVVGIQFLWKSISQVRSTNLHTNHIQILVGNQSKEV